MSSGLMNSLRCKRFKELCSFCKGNVEIKIHVLFYIK